MPHWKFVRKTGYRILDRLQTEEGHFSYPITATKVLDRPIDMLDFIDAYTAIRTKYMNLSPEKINGERLEAVHEKIKVEILEAAREQGGDGAAKRWQYVLDNDIMIRLSGKSPFSVSLLSKAMTDLETIEAVKRFIHQYVRWTMEKGDTDEFLMGFLRQYELVPANVTGREAVRLYPDIAVRAQISRLLLVQDAQVNARWNTAVGGLYHSTKARSEAFEDAQR